MALVYTTTPERHKSFVFVESTDIDVRPIETFALWTVGELRGLVFSFQTICLCFLALEWLLDLIGMMVANFLHEDVARLSRGLWKLRQPNGLSFQAAYASAICF